MDEPATGHPILYVNLPVHRDDSDGINFDDLFNGVVDAEGERIRSMMLSVKTEVVDPHGHKFVGTLNGETARFVLFEVKLRNQESFEKKHENMRPRDFEIVISNPDRRDGQPQSVSVQLR